MSDLSDQLLQEILAELQSQRGSGGSGSGGGTGNNPKSMSIWTKASGLVSALGNQASAAAEGVIKLGAAASSGAAGLSEVVGILPRLPGALGVFSSALSLAASVVEKNLATQQELSKSGATFGGSLTDMRIAAAGAYLSLDQFSGVVKANSDVFSSMGGNVQSGVEQFSKIQKMLLKPGSDTANMLANLGMNSADAAATTASYLRSQGSMNKQELQDTKAVSAAVANYAGELTMLSSITGKSREAIQAELDEKNKEAQYQAYLASLSPVEAEKMRSGMALAMAQGGKGAQDAFQAMAMGFPPMTQAARMYAATQSAGMDSLKQYNARVKDSSISAEQASSLNRKTLAKQIADSANDYERMKVVLQASALEGGALAESASATTAMMTKYKGMTAEQIEAEMLSVEAKQKGINAAGEVSKTEAANAQNQQKAMQDLTNTILAKMMPALNFLLSAFVKGADYLGNLLIPAFDAIDFKPLLSFFDKMIMQIDWNTIGTTLSGTFKTVGSVLTSIGISLEPVFIQIAGVLNSMLPKILPIIQDIGVIITRIFEVLSPLLTPIIDGISIVLGAFFDKIGGIIKIVKGLVTGDFGEIATGIQMYIGAFFERLFGIIKLFKDVAVGGARAVWNLLTGGTPEKEPQEIPKRAAGGPVQKGVPTLVGERGIELFLPPQDGQIVSNSSLVNQASKSESANVTPSAQGNAVQAAGMKSLQTEIQTLNKTMADVLKYIKDTAENTRQNVSATKSLDGNLFARP
jgi:hypothetical protein